MTTRGSRTSRVEVVLRTGVENVGGTNTAYTHWDVKYRSKGDETRVDTVANCHVATRVLTRYNVANTSECVSVGEGGNKLGRGLSGTSLSTHRAADPTGKTNCAVSRKSKYGVDITHNTNMKYRHGYPRVVMETVREVVVVETSTTCLVLTCGTKVSSNTCTCYPLEGSYVVPVARTPVRVGVAKCSRVRTDKANKVARGPVCGSNVGHLPISPGVLTRVYTTEVRSGT